MSTISHISQSNKKKNLASNKIRENASYEHTTFIQLFIKRKGWESDNNKKFRQVLLCFLLMLP